MPRICMIAALRFRQNIWIWAIVMQAAPLDLSNSQLSDTNAAWAPSSQYPQYLLAPSS